MRQEEVEGLVASAFLNLNNWEEGMSLAEIGGKIC